MLIQPCSWSLRTLDTALESSRWVGRTFVETKSTFDREDAVVEETRTTDSWLSAFEGEGGLTYDEIFQAGAEEEEAAVEAEETEVMGRMGGRKFDQSLISN